MSVILKQWQTQPSNPSSITVLPDGCRDLIFKRGTGWFISDLAESHVRVDLQPDDYYLGFRLQPGVRIDQAALLDSLSDDLGKDAVLERLHHCASPITNVSEALLCLSNRVKTIDQAAADLGVQTRSLQRLLKQQTGRSPVFWLRLARVRRAANRLSQPKALADLAYDMGYADQAHMTREFRHWLGVTPHQISRDAGWLAQNFGLGYGA